MQVSRELNLSPKLVYYLTRDIVTGNPRNRGIAGKSLTFFEKLMNEGYIISTEEYSYNLYEKIRLQFPKIRLRRVKIDGIVIYFLQNNSNAAKRAFLEIWNRKHNRRSLKISGHKLQQINDVFAANASKKDRKMIYSQQRK